MGMGHLKVTDTTAEMMDSFDNLVKYDIDDVAAGYERFMAWQC